MQTNSTCYKKTRTMTVKGVLWHSTGVNNPNIKRYVQPSDNAPDRSKMLAILGTNEYKNDWNHVSADAGLNAWIGKLADDSVATVQTMPWNYRPWGCGSGTKGSCNDGWIQFEICESDLNDKSYFDKVYKEACELTAYLCDIYNLDPYGHMVYNGVKVPVILCHKDSYTLKMGSGHEDVYHWFKKYGKTMDDVRKDVAALMKSDISANTNVDKNNKNSESSATPEIYRIRKSWEDSKTQIGAYHNLAYAKKACDEVGGGYKVFDSSGKVVYPSKSFESYLVKITANELNIRKGAGTNYSIGGSIKKNEVYTIVDEANGYGATKWGLLKSYANKRNGWISLDYVKRV